MPRSTARLLHEFEETARLVRPFAIERFGEEGAEALHREARRHYAEIIPQISWVRGARAPVMNAFLRGTAQEIAVYLAIRDRGGTPAEAWEICHEANRQRMANLPAWKRSLARRLWFSGLVRRIARRRADRGEEVAAGDFRIRFQAGAGDDFDWGIDYVRCGNLELARKLGAEAFAPYVCMSDIVLSDALGWGLTRTQTLADGCSHCDFRFKKDAETRISSKTPAVQGTIERIARRESELSQ